MYCLGQGAVSAHDADDLPRAVIVILESAGDRLEARFSLLPLKNIVKPHLTLDGRSTLIELNSVIVDLGKVSEESAGQAIPRPRVGDAENLVALVRHLLLRFFHVAAAGTPLPLLALGPLAEGAFGGLGAGGVRQTKILTRACAGILDPLALPDQP